MPTEAEGTSVHHVLVGPACRRWHVGPLLSRLSPTPIKRVDGQSFLLLRPFSPHREVSHCRTCHRLWPPFSDSSRIATPCDCALLLPQVSSPTTPPSPSPTHLTPPTHPVSHRRWQSPSLPPVAGVLLCPTPRARAVLMQLKNRARGGLLPLLAAHPPRRHAPSPTLDHHRRVVPPRAPLLGFAIAAQSPSPVDGCAADPVTFGPPLSHRPLRQHWRPGRDDRTSSTPHVLWPRSARAPVAWAAKGLSHGPASWARPD
jgi:hypothetical protein